jgi:hypothetical protein
MQRDRLKRLNADIRRHFPPPRTPGLIRVVQVPSSHVLDSAELDRASAAIPRKPGESCRILINVVQVKSRVRQPAEIHGPAAGRGAVDQAREPTEAELEFEVRRLERRKVELLAVRRLDDRKREERVRKVKRVLEDAEERRRR